MVDRWAWLPGARSVQCRFDGNDVDVVQSFGLRSVQLTRAENCVQQGEGSGLGGGAVSFRQGGQMAGDRLRSENQ